MLKLTHFALGLLMILVFLLTGQYMDHQYDHLANMESMNRALFRAGHLYILLFALINLALGSYLHLYSSSAKRALQGIGSVLIFMACGLIVMSFFNELPSENIERPTARYALYLILAGVSLHGLTSVLSPKP